MGIRPASIESLYRRRSIAQITRRVERCDLKAIHVMENHHGQSSTCHRLDLYIVNTSHGRIDQSPRRSTRGTSSRSINIKNDGVRRQTGCAPATSTTPTGRRATTRLLMAPTAASSERVVAPCDFTGTHPCSVGAWFCLVTLTCWASSEVR